MGMDSNAMSAALVRCAQLRHPYRGPPRLSEALDLLKINDYHELLQRRSKLIAGKLTWARVAGVAVSAAAKALLLGDADRALPYVEDVRTLADRALGHGEDAPSLARAAGVQTTTTWNRFNLVAPFFPPDEVKRRVARLVSPDLWMLLTRMVEEQRAVVGGPLSELMPEVQKALGRSGAFRRSDWQWEELRLCRLAAVL